MLLKNLRISLCEYGANEGKHVGKAEFVGKAGSVELRLSPEHCERIFAVCADALVYVAREAARNLTCQVVEHREALAIPPQPDRYIGADPGIEVGATTQGRDERGEVPGG